MVINAFDSAVETTLNVADSLNIGSLSHPNVEAKKKIDWYEQYLNATDGYTK